MSDFARVEVFESGANSFYNGLTLALKRRFAKRYQVNLAYTFSKAIDDVIDFTSVVPFNSIDEGKMAEYPTLPGSDRGPSINDQRQRVITNFVWNLDYFHGLKNPARYLIDGWSLSGVILAQTGQPYSNAIGGDSVNDTNSQTSRVPQDGRNTNYAPTISNWDLRLTKAIPLYRERVNFVLALDAFNAFNEAEFLAGNVRNGKYNFSAATGLFTPATNFGTYASQTLDRLPGVKNRLSVLTAGQRSRDYFKLVRGLDVADFYSSRDGGSLIEDVRNRWKENYDFVLVDSRTGLTEIGGVCTLARWRRAPRETCSSDRPHRPSAPSSPRHSAVTVTSMLKGVSQNRCRYYFPKTSPRREEPTACRWQRVRTKWCYSTTTIDLDPKSANACSCKR
jgi:hypothetical protein